MDAQLQIKEEPELREEIKPQQAISNDVPSLGFYTSNNPSISPVNESRPIPLGVGLSYNRTSDQLNFRPTNQTNPTQTQVFGDQSSRLQAYYNEQLNRLQAYYKPSEVANFPQGFYNQQVNLQVRQVAKPTQALEATVINCDSSSTSFKYNEDADALDMSINTAAFCEAVIDTQSVKREMEEEKQNQLAKEANHRASLQFPGINSTPTKSGRRTVQVLPQPPPGLEKKKVNTCVIRPKPPGGARTPAEKTHLCTVCNARFTQSSHLNTHRRQHTGEKPYACEVCPARFNQSAHLTTHRRKHTGERPYICDQCPANFTQSDSLTKHKRQHTGEKPYPCQQCDARFTQPSSLTRHNRLHAGEKPYACNECEARFNTSSHLTRHKLQHTGEKPYGCTDCEARFTQRIHLITHRRQHTGEKPFACTECSARFAQKSNLVSHKRTHTGFKPHQCTSCLKRFARLSYVKLHTQTCHSQHGLVAHAATLSPHAGLVRE